MDRYSTIQLMDAAKPQPQQEGRLIQGLKSLSPMIVKHFTPSEAHSIIKLTKMGTPTNINKMITGHGVGDVNTDVYFGVSVEGRFEWIRE